MKYSLILVSILFVACSSDELYVGFYEIGKEQSGIFFSNNIEESDSFNYYTFPYLFMGGGVSAIDVNNDGLQDLFFTGNMVPNKLYLNNGDLTFEDISETAGVKGDERWYTGSTIVDINRDGWMDLYLSVAGQGFSENELYINNGDLTFSESAAAYGLNDPAKSIQATFFDFDRDGLEDVFVANYPIVPVSMGNQFYLDKMNENKLENAGHLFRNLGNGSFKDVTEESGVQRFGLTLGIVASDFNNDGWPDLYLSNDFNVPDYFYINNQDGTFSEELASSFRHTSMFGMGCDAGDMNNDGLVDFMQVDMTPADYIRAKTNMASMSPQTFYEGIDLGFHYQYMQNALQLNYGIDPEGLPQFGDIARITGTATTDWSWGVQFADLNNDGYQDLFVSNGMKRDVNNNDANLEFQKANFFDNRRGDYTKLPSQPLSNYVFQSNHDFSFDDRTLDWGLNDPGFSNGFTTVDLDNDGDLEIVINNLDDQASIFENKMQGHYLKIKFDPKENSIGSKVYVGNQMREVSYSRGFQSSVPNELHFGLNEQEIVPEVRVVWNDGEIQMISNIHANQTLVVKKEAKQISKLKPDSNVSAFRVEEIDVLHEEDNYDDFKYEPLLPHRNSMLGPALAVGDVDGNGLEDFYLGGAAGFVGQMMLQKKSGHFAPLYGVWELDSLQEDVGAIFCDVDGDHDLDLYVVSGGNDPTAVSTFYRDRLYINNGNGLFSKSLDLPIIDNSGLVVVAADFNNDEAIDLFVPGRIMPGRYPHKPPSFLLENRGQGNFEKLELTEMQGMITSVDAIDFDEDGWTDLVVTGEWMSIDFYRNVRGEFELVNSIDSLVGWNYSIESADLDLDGDIDWVVGNLGKNYKYQAPFEIYANDFDENNSLDIVLGYEKEGKKVPVRGRECSSQQVPAIAERFETYASFAQADLAEIYGDKMLDESMHLVAKNFASIWLENKGNMEFEIHQLPVEAQFSSINAIEILDYNLDQYPDLLLFGNLYEAEVETPRNDGSIGLLLHGSATGFTPVSSAQSGIFIEGNIRGLAKIHCQGKTNYLIARNSQTVQRLVFMN